MLKSSTTRSAHAQNQFPEVPSALSRFDSLRRMNTSLLQVSGFRLACVRGFNCWTAAITKKHRQLYVRTYPCTVVRPDGSSVNIEYSEPRRIIVLPVDVSKLSEDEYKKILVRRLPRQKVKFMEEIEDSFDESRYLKRSGN